MHLQRHTNLQCALSSVQGRGSQLDSVLPGYLSVPVLECSPLLPLVMVKV